MGHNCSPHKPALFDLTEISSDAAKHGGSVICSSGGDLFSFPFLCWLKKNLLIGASVVFFVLGSDACCGNISLLDDDVFALVLST